MPSHCVENVDDEFYETKRRDIIKCWGSWTNFMQSYGLKPWQPNDVEEANAIIDKMIEQEMEDK